MSCPIACIVKCSCGGKVEYLNDGVFYILTERNTVIFQGTCSSCLELVKVEREIATLFLMCPTEERRVH